MLQDLILSLLHHPHPSLHHHLTSVNLAKALVTPAQMYQMLQHFTERLKGNLKNVLHHHHVDTKKTRVNVPRVEGQCLNTSEVLKS